jgi:hypothetical protein
MALSSSPPGDSNRRESKEWDASKVPPSQFQRRKGSIYSTPNSRDGHVKGSSRDQAYWEKLKEKVTHSCCSGVSFRVIHMVMMHTNKLQGWHGSSGSK